MTQDKPRAYHFGTDIPIPNPDEVEKARARADADWPIILTIILGTLAMIVLMLAFNLAFPLG